MKNPSFQYIKNILTALRTQVEKFAHQTAPQSLEYKSSFYGGDENNPASFSAVLEYERFFLEFVYLVKTDQTGPKSVLECRVWLPEEQMPFYCTLYDLMYLLDRQNFKCYLFPYIENAQRMEACFTAMAQDLKGFLPKLAQIAADPQACEQVYQLFKEEITNIWDSGLFETAENVEETRRKAIINDRVSMYRDWQRKCFTDAAYRAFLNGDYKKAVNLYSKQNKRLSYEERLLAFIQTIPQGQKYAAVPLGADSQGLIAGLSKGSAGLLPVFLTALILLPVFFGLFTGLYYGVLHLVNPGAVYITGSNFYSALAMLLPAILTSVMLSFYQRKRIYRLFFKKNAQKLLEYDAILHTGAVYRFIGMFFTAAVIGSLLFTVLTANNNIAFYEDGFVNHTDRGVYQGQHRAYSDIESVWVLSVRGADATEVNKFAFMFGDYKSIELSDYMNYVDFEQYVMPLLKENHVNFEWIKKNQ